MNKDRMSKVRYVQDAVAAASIKNGLLVGTAYLIELAEETWDILTEHGYGDDPKDTLKRKFIGESEVEALRDNTITRV